MSNKSLLKQNHVWGTINPGTVAVAEEFYQGRDKRKPDMAFPDGETIRRRFIPYAPWNCTLGEPDHGDVRLIFYDATGHSFAIQPDEIDIIKMKPVAKEFRSNATPGSVWQFKEDWTFAGYHDTQIEHTIAAGTEVKITGKKMVNVRYGGMEELALTIEQNPDIACFFPPRSYDKNFHLPAKEVWPYLELVTAGKQKTYWIVEDKVGKKLLTKRYANIGNVKSAIRVRGGLVKSKYNVTGREEDYIPEWIDGSDGYTDWEVNMDNGMYAVEYDHATDKEIKREDMLEYFTFAKLTQF